MKNLFNLAYVSSVLIPIIYYYFDIKNSETYKREKNSILMLIFLWGMGPSIILSFISNTYFYNKMEIKYNIEISNLMTSIIAAPLFEEVYKVIGILLIRKVYKNIDEIEDGIIYSSISGLGFAFIENIFYSIEYAEKIEEKISLIVLRQLTSTIVHITSAGKIGQGISFLKIKKQKKKFLKYFFNGIFIHSFHNTLASLPEIAPILSSFFNIKILKKNKNIGLFINFLFGLYLISSRLKLLGKQKNLVKKYDNETKLD